MLALAAHLERVADELEGTCRCPPASYDQGSAHAPTCPQSKVNSYDRAWAAHLRLDARGPRLLALTDRHRAAEG